MITYSDLNEEIFIGIFSDDPEEIVGILEDLFGYEFIKTKSDKFEDIGALYKDSVVVNFGLVDDEFLITMADEQIQVLIVPRR